MNVFGSVCYSQLHQLASKAIWLHLFVWLVAHNDRFRDTCSTYHVSTNQDRDVPFLEYMHACMQSKHVQCVCVCVSIKGCKVDTNLWNASAIIVNMATSNTRLNPYDQSGARWQSMKLFLVWDSEGVAEKTDSIVEDLFECADSDSDDGAGRGSRGGKGTLLKRKREPSGSDDKSSNGSEDEDSESSSAKVPNWVCVFVCKHLPWCVLCWS